MSKIIVPKELREKIVDLYVNQKFTRVQIKKALNLEFGDSVIKRILEEENIEIRSNPGALKGGRKKQEVDPELVKKIIEEYNKGYGLDKIVKNLNLPFGFDKVKSVLEDNNIHIRGVQEAHKVMTVKDLRKYPINDDYCLESHNGAWLLGFIAADGYLPVGRGAKRRITISLAEKDEEILHRIAKDIGYGGEIKHYVSTEGFPFVSLSFSSKPLREKIEAYGIGNNKTFKLYHLPNLPREYMIDFIRGFFDGDGSVFRINETLKFGSTFTCASGHFLNEIVDFLHEELGMTRINIHSYYRIHEIFEAKYGKADTVKMCDAFYNNDYLALDRKKQHYFALKEMYCKPLRK